MSAPFYPPPPTMRSVNLKNDLVLAAQRAQDAKSPDQLEDALRSVMFFCEKLQEK